MGQDQMGVVDAAGLSVDVCSSWVLFLRNLYNCFKSRGLVGRVFFYGSRLVLKFHTPIVLQLCRSLATSPKSPLDNQRSCGTVSVGGGEKWDDKGQITSVNKITRMTLRALSLCYREWTNEQPTLRKSVRHLHLQYPQPAPWFLLYLRSVAHQKRLWISPWEVQRLYFVPL